MQAKETKLQDIIEGTKQYVIPLFQRSYSWAQKEWNAFGNDLIELAEMENPRTHFIGSIVNMPTTSVPEGIAKYLLIDGQQRITTIFIILILLRNKAKEIKNLRLADEINNTLLVNQYKDGQDHYKIMPTQIDRDAYINLIDGESNQESQLNNAYAFFEKKIKQISFDIEKLKKIITSYLSVVSIVLDADDNPYLVFESLNAKGRPLTQADLIRNYFFMRIHIDNQDDIYKLYWAPMQETMKDNLTEYIRHFLMKTGSIVKQSDVYYELKENVSITNAIEYLKNLKTYSEYYHCLKLPSAEPEPELRTILHRLNRMEVTTAYPLLLNFYNDYKNNIITKNDYIDILNILENYLIRRFICNHPTNQLNKIFPSVYSTIESKYNRNFVSGLKMVLQDKGYPKDNEFITRFKDAKLYGSGDRSIKARLILEALEKNTGHKEMVSFDNLTIEHIMPQTLDPDWQKNLGDNWAETHDLFLHTIGNLTLTAYNTELSNDNFLAKKEKLKNSHIELNKYFEHVTEWTRIEIEKRSDILTEKALTIWPYFGQENSPLSDAKEVTGTTPVSLMILGQYLSVASWRDVFEQTLNVIAELEPDKFDTIVQSLSHYIGKDKTQFKAVRQLQNNYFIEVNLSAHTIQKLCYRAMETIDLTSEDWRVTVSQ